MILGYIKYRIIYRMRFVCMFEVEKFSKDNKKHVKNAWPEFILKQNACRKCMAIIYFETTCMSTMHGHNLC